MVGATSEPQVQIRAETPMLQFSTVGFLRGRTANVNQMQNLWSSPRDD
ncbi:uncharacterized protein METZ01_LOCUS167205, partial [marine metagenome]